MTLQEHNKMDEMEQAITANDELMQLLDQVITLQDKMITDLYKEVDHYMTDSRMPLYRGKLFDVKGVDYDEYKLHVLKRKISEFGKKLSIETVV
jgi:hypothetical protein